MMEFWNTQILPRLTSVEVIEWFTFGVNILVYIFFQNYRLTLRCHSG